MKAIRKITALMLSLIMALGVFALSASATSKKKAPISIKVETSASSADYLGVIVVTVTVKNTSSAKISNIVASSSDSVGLVMCKPKVKNVVISNPGKIVSSVSMKNNAMTTCLLPGGTMKYSYSVLMGYKYSRNLIPESTSNLMAKQHKLLNTKYFRDISVNAPSVSASKVLKFGDVNTGLVVKAYYSVSGSTYNSIASGNTINETYKVAERSDSTGNGKSGIKTDFKQWVDAYEEFMLTNLYFIKHADEMSPASYLVLLAEYEKYIDQADKYESDDTLTADEIAYFNNAQAVILAYELTI